MQIKLLHTGPLGTNTYILYGGQAGQCAVVDPAAAEPVLAFLQKEGLACTDILVTHGHFDHIMGVAPLKDATGAKVSISELDAPALAQEDLHDPLHKISTWGYTVPPCAPDRLLRDGDVVEAAGFTLRALATPGHTKGGLCFVLDAPEKVVFAGDTLFRANVGRCDLPGGSPRELHASIRDKLFTLPGDYAVYPGHEGATTLAYERASNPYMTRWSPEEW